MQYIDVSKQHSVRLNQTQCVCQLYLDFLKKAYVNIVSALGGEVDFLCLYSVNSMCSLTFPS